MFGIEDDAACVDCVMAAVSNLPATGNRKAKL